MSTEAVEGTGLPVSADAGIAEAAVFGVSPGYFLRQIHPLDPAGEDTTACGWIAGLRRCLCRRRGCVGAARGAATRQPGCLEPVTRVADERCAVNLADGSLCLGLIRAPTRIYRSCRTSLASAASRHAHALC